MWHLYLVLKMRSFEVKKRKYHTEKIASLSNNNKIVETEPKRIPSHTHIYIYMNVHSSGLAHILLRKCRGSTRTPPNNEMMRSCTCLPRESAISTLTYIWVSMRST